MANFTESHRWKVFMKYLYGWGASVVLVGALFKLTHWPGANLMLTIGLLVEAGIFFFSAFEPLHEELDWTLVYPQLAGLTDAIDIPSEKETTLPASTEALGRFNAMIEKAGDTNVFEKFGAGIENLSDKVSQMSDISDASLATNEYTENMKGAAGAVGTLIESYNKSAEAVSYSADSLSDSFNSASEKVSNGGTEFAEAYQRLTNSMDLDFSSLKEGNSEYNTHISSLNKNLSALNAIFELQLNETDLDQMMADLQGSVEHSKIYNTEITKLGQKLEALNTVYGNMLSAMNINMD
ncbi:MAG: gliding motility protein GldL [Bacteroidales bacterium]|nr:gliding motility protein GldL [Bacteroidales bacterium]